MCQIKSRVFLVNNKYLCIVRNSRDWPMFLLSAAKKDKKQNRAALSHFQLILEFFRV
jgi:hypothetical protein